MSALLKLKHHREVDFELGSLPRLRLYPDTASALLDHAIYGGKTQTGSLALFLGSEVRLKNGGLGVGVHSLPRIRDNDPYVLAGQHRRASLCKFVILRHVAGFNGQSTTLWHGVAGIYRQIHDHLFDLSRVSLHQSQRLARLTSERDVFPNNPSE